MLAGPLSPHREAHAPGPALAAAAASFGTPAYLMDLAAVAAAAARLEAAFGGPWLRLFSLKANDLPAITSFLHGRGWGASVVSTGEWRHARAAGVANDAVAFEGIGKSDAQLGFAVTEAAAGRPVRWLALESGQEAAVLAGLAAAAGLGRDGRPSLDVLVRLNPEVAPETRAEFAVGARASKFGMTGREILALAADGALAGPGLRLRGVQVHVGSDLTDVRAFCDAGVRAARLLAALRAVRPDAARPDAVRPAAIPPDAARWLDTIDFGGGFPLPAPGLPGPEDFRDALAGALDRAGLALPPRPAIEPGRYLVGAAGWLIASVLHARPDTGGAQLVVLDAGMTEFIRPALYRTRHPVYALADGPGSQATPGLLDTAVEGPVCESTDSFGRHLLPPLRRGDLVAIGQAGAYGASFTSRYNGRPPPAEILFRPDGSLAPGERPPLTASQAPTRWE